MSDDDLRLNSLERFQKHSQRLVLEEHGHCEVPAGCGGVVLRWFNPDSGVPVIFHFGFAEQAELYVDGEEVAGSRATVAIGEHVLAIHAVLGESDPGCVWLAGLRDTAEHREPDEARVLPALLTVGDGTWRATFSAPGDSWAATGFDDRGWSTLDELSGEPELPDRSRRWELERMRNFGAAALDLNRQQEVWVRKHFVMEADE